MLQVEVRRSSTCEGGGWNTDIRTVGGVSAPSASKHSSSLLCFSVDTLYIHTHTHTRRWQIKCECTTHTLEEHTHKQKKGRCIMGRQKVWSHSLCKHTSRSMSDCMKRSRWFTHSLPPFVLWNNNLICTVAILQLSRCMYSRFTWANVLNAFNFFLTFFFPVQAWFFSSPLCTNVYKSSSRRGPCVRRNVRDAPFDSDPPSAWRTFITPQQAKGRKEV